MNAKLTSIYMQWQYWKIRAEYYLTMGHNYVDLFEDALQRCSYIQQEFEYEMSKNET